MSARTRVFRMGPTELPDLDPSMKPDQVREEYAKDFGHLANATVEGPTPRGEVDVYVFENAPVKTKG